MVSAGGRLKVAGIQPTERTGDERYQTEDGRWRVKRENAELKTGEEAGWVIDGYVESGAAGSDGQG